MENRYRFFDKVIEIFSPSDLQNKKFTQTHLDLSRQLFINIPETELKLAFAKQLHTHEPQWMEDFKQQAPHYNAFMHFHTALTERIQFELLKHYPSEKIILRWIKRFKCFLEARNYQSACAIYFAFQYSCIDRLMTEMPENILEPINHFKKKFSRDCHDDFRKEMQKDNDRNPSVYFFGSYKRHIDLSVEEEKEFYINCYTQLFMAAQRDLKSQSNEHPVENIFSDKASLYQDVYSLLCGLSKMPKNVVEKCKNIFCDETELPIDRKIIKQKFETLSDLQRAEITILNYGSVTESTLQDALDIISHYRKASKNYGSYPSAADFSDSKRKHFVALRATGSSLNLKSLLNPLPNNKRPISVSLSSHSLWNESPTTKTLNVTPREAEKQDNETLNLSLKNNGLKKSASCTLFPKEKHTSNNNVSDKDYIPPDLHLSPRFSFTPDE